MVKLSGEIRAPSQGNPSQDRTWWSGANIWSPFKGLPVRAEICKCSSRRFTLTEYMSSRHPNIRFTYEEEVNNALPFLDVNVFRDADRLSSTVHRKDTFSGVYTNYLSFMPDTYKKGLVSTLLHRAYEISSSHQSVHKEVENLKKKLAKMVIPPVLLTNVFSNSLIKFLRKRTLFLRYQRRNSHWFYRILETLLWKLRIRWRGVSRNLCRLRNWR